MRSGNVHLACLAGAGLALLTSCGDATQSTGNILLKDENNYRTMADLTIPVVVTTAATDADICWSAIVDDIQCHPVSATADLDNVSLLRIAHLSQDQVRGRVADGSLSQSDVSGYVDFQTDHTTTCTKLSSLSFFGTVIDIPSQYIESDDYTYLLLFSKGTTPGLGARTMTFLQPSANSPNTKIDAPTGCGMLDFSADLMSLTKLSVPSDGPWLLDWRGIKRDGQGNEVPFQKIDGVSVGFYANLTVADLQARIFDIELIATNLYDIKLPGGRTADLATATDRKTGETFPGFARTETGTWMLALTCSKCQNPAPVLLTIIEPSAGGT